MFEADDSGILKHLEVSTDTSLKLIAESIPSLTESEIAENAAAAN